MSLVFVMVIMDVSSGGNSKRMEAVVVIIFVVAFVVVTVVIAVVINVVLGVVVVVLEAEVAEVTVTIADATIDYRCAVTPVRLAAFLAKNYLF